MEKKDHPEEQLDPQKFFNEKEYNTIFVNREGITKKQGELYDLVNDILDKDLSRQELENIFTKLKQAEAQQVLVSAIQQARTDSDRAKLCAACWECGLEFRDYFLFFADLVLHKDFLLAMEALTVVENIEGRVTEEELNKSLVKAQDYSGPNKDIVSDLIENLKSRMT